MNSATDSATPSQVTIARLNARGFGVVANPPGEIGRLHLAGALPGEEIQFHLRAKRSGARWGLVENVITPSPHRVQPKCPHAPGNLPCGPGASVCGGCAMQHIDYAEQLRIKQERVAALFAAKSLTVNSWADPLASDPFGYRHQARIGVRWVAKKGRLLAGFRESLSNRITDCTRCEVLIPSVGRTLDKLTQCLAGLSIADQIAQVEVVSGDEHAALIVRHLTPLPHQDAARLADFGREHSLGVYTQSGGPHSIAPLLLPDGFTLDYTLDGLRIGFAPGDFIQNNLKLNRTMVAQAIDWLAPQTHERIIDLFCGIGNFSLPLARRCKALAGVEGSEQSVARGGDNAKRNAITNASFHAADLSNRLALEQQAPDWWREDYAAALLDPPRSGAGALTGWLCDHVRSRLLYVSCNPESLVKDIVGLAGSYRLVRAGIIDMFPHTAHCEVMCLLEKR